MTITRNDWENGIRSASPQQEARRHESTIASSLLRQAQVATQLLTSDPAWDVFLQRLQVWLNEAQGEVATIQARLCTPLTETQLHLDYVALNVITERVRVLQQVMAMPKEILTHAHETLDKRPE